jgi:hypothetical protein
VEEEVVDNFTLEVEEQEDIVLLFLEEQKLH